MGFARDAKHTGALIKQVAGFKYPDPVYSPGLLAICYLANKMEELLLVNSNNSNFGRYAAL